MQQQQSLPTPSFFAHSIVLLDPPFSRVPRLLEVFSSFCYEQARSGLFLRDERKEETLRRGMEGFLEFIRRCRWSGVERISLHSGMEACDLGDGNDDREMS